MNNVSYTLFIWLIGVCVSPVLFMLISEGAMGSGFISIFLLFIIFAGLFSIPTQIVFMLIFIYGIRENFHTTLSIKIATQVTVVILTLLTFFVILEIFGDINRIDLDFFLLPFSYILTMSAGVWLLKIKTEENNEVEWDDDVL